MKSTPREYVVVQEWYYKFDPNAETLYASVYTTTTTTDTITRCYFNVRSKADVSQLNLPHGNRQLV